MKRLLVNLWCIGLSLSAGVLASVGCVDDGPATPILQGAPGPFAPPDAGQDSGVAGSAMSQAGGGGQGGSGQGGASMGGTGSGIVDAGGGDADTGS
jgi:hypothetical protein